MSSAADLACADKALALPEARPPSWSSASIEGAPPAATLFTARPVLAARDLDQSEIAVHFGSELRHVEQDGSTLLSFFVGAQRHVVLAAGLAVALIGVGATAGLAQALSALTFGRSMPLAACRSGTSDAPGPEVRMTCYLTAVVPLMLGEASYTRLYGPKGTLPLQVYPATQASSGYEASAVVRDAAGIGSVIFVVMRQSGRRRTRCEWIWVTLSSCMVLE